MPIQRIDNYKETGNRVYTNGNLVRPSCSWLKSHIIEADLKKWLTEKDANYIEDRSSRGKAIGSAVHDAIHQMESYPVTVSDLPPDVQGAAQAFVQFREDQKLEGVSSETFVFSEKYGFGGTYDRIAVIHGKKYLIDWKTGHYTNIDLWTTEAYRRAYVEMTGDADIGTMVVYFRKDGKNFERTKKPYITYTPKHLDFCFERFLGGCLDTWKGLYFNDLLKMGFELSYLTESAVQKFHNGG